MLYGLNLIKSYLKNGATLVIFGSLGLPHTIGGALIGGQYSISREGDLGKDDYFGRN